MYVVQKVKLGEDDWVFLQHTSNHFKADILVSNTTQPSSDTYMYIVNLRNETNRLVFVITCTHMLMSDQSNSPSLTDLHK